MSAAPPGRLLVVGASGLVGGELWRAATQRGGAVVGAARTPARGATLALDLQDRAAIDRGLREVEPDAVAICSAWPHVDGCEQDPERSERENVGTVRNLLAALGSSSPVRLLFFSTDHVFDGSKETYLESDAVRPLSVYAKHKREVEELLLARGRSLIVRTAWVFGSDPRRKNFTYRVIDAAESGIPLRVPRAQAGCPTWARWLAESSLELWRGGMEGVVHLAGDRALTKAVWARLVAEMLALPPLEIVELDWADAGQVAARPRCVRLVSERHSLSHPDLAGALRAEMRGE